MFSEEPTVEEDDFASQEKHQESHSEVEDSQEDFVYEATSDNVSPTNIFVPIMFLDDNEIKFVNE